MNENEPNWRLEFFKIIAQERRLEIENFWRRSLFYWGFITATGLAYFKVVELQPRVPLIEAAIAHFGLFCSCCWFTVNRGSKFWQENWEQKVESFEAQWKLYKPVAPIQRKFLGAAEYSVTRTTVLLSLVTSCLWLLPIAHTYRAYGARCSTVLPSVLLAIALVGLFGGCKSKLPDQRFAK